MWRSLQAGKWESGADLSLVEVRWDLGEVDASV
jgi:hypothetical protein